MGYNSGQKVMSSKTFNRFKHYIQDNIGISIPDAKKIMVESRLLRRLRFLDFSNYEEYADYFFGPTGYKEVPHFINCITTNKTDFFREVEHFNFMVETALPKIIKELGRGEIRLWSGASSTGEEAYTMAMLMENFLETKSGFSYRILATDISEEVLEAGRRAVYSEESTLPIPLEFKKKYCLKSRDRDNPTVRIKKNIRKRVLFNSINLKADSYNIKKDYHIIFLRNVMIYFNKTIQANILDNLYRHLSPNGYLFLGHSENLPSQSLPFKRIGPSIYVKKENPYYG